jgi:hypothetical protein
MLKINKKSKDNYILSLLNHENIGIHLHLTAGMDLIHTLKKMLLDSVGSAAWDQLLLQANEEKAKKTEPPGYIS